MNYYRVHFRGFEGYEEIKFTGWWLAEDELDAVKKAISNLYGGKGDATEWVDGGDGRMVPIRYERIPHGDEVRSDTRGASIKIGVIQALCGCAVDVRRARARGVEE